MSSGCSSKSSSCRCSSSGSSSKQQKTALLLLLQGHLDCPPMPSALEKTDIRRDSTRDSRRKGLYLFKRQEGFQLSRRDMKKTETAEHRQTNNNKKETVTKREGRGDGNKLKETTKGRRDSTDYQTHKSSLTLISTPHMLLPLPPLLPLLLLLLLLLLFLPEGTRAAAAANIGRA